MTNSLNQHRRRLNIILNEQQSSALEPPEQEINLSASDQESEPKKTSDTDSGPSIASSQPASSKADAIAEVQPPASPYRFFSRRDLMNYSRHILVVAIITSFAYLYSQHQKPDQTTQTSPTVSEPFSDFDSIAQAPAFNTNTVSQSGNNVPMSISLTNDETPSLLKGSADLSDWVEEKTPFDSSGITVDVKTSRKKNRDSTKISKFRKKSLSLWDQPNQQSQQEQVESIASRNQDYTSRFDNKHEDEYHSTNKVIDQYNDSSNYSKAPEIETSTEIEINTEQNAIAEETEQPWRQFTLGSGKQTTLCVIDDSVTNDALLLSTIFTGIRREWMSDVARSQTQRLILLIDNSQKNNSFATNLYSSDTRAIQQKELELQQKIEDSSPSRIVYLSRGYDNRGWIKFSSEQESVAALLSVPGMYRITSQKQTESYNSQYQLPQPQKVHIELPVQAQDPTTVDLIFTAMSGNWNKEDSSDTSDFYASRNSYQTTTNKPDTSAYSKQNKRSYSQKYEEQDTTQTPFEDQMNKPRKQKGRVEILPSPSKYHQQANSNNKSSSKNFFKLPPAPVHDQGY